MRPKDVRAKASPVVFGKGEKKLALHRGPTLANAAEAVGKGGAGPAFKLSGKPERTVEFLDGRQRAPFYSEQKRVFREIDEVADVKGPKLRERFDAQVERGALEPLAPRNGIGSRVADFIEEHEPGKARSQDYSVHFLTTSAAFWPPKPKFSSSMVSAETLILSRTKLRPSQQGPLRFLIGGK